MSKNISKLSERKGLKNNLFESLGLAAEKNNGTPSETDLKKIADEFLLGKAIPYGTATFYDFLKPENQNKKVYICNGSACLCSGKQEDLKKNLKHYFSDEEIGHMTCLGRCHENGAFHYNGHNYSAKSGDEIEKIFKQNKTPNKDQYHIDGTNKILTGSFDFDAFNALLNKSLNQSKETLLQEIKTSEIRGRGGAGFPMGIKWEACKNENADTKFIICNADEGDPGAYSDRYLLENQPYAVLFGMLIAGYITGAQWGVLYIRAEYPESVEIINKAIKQLAENKLIGDNILNTGFNFNFKVIKARGAYICGEETALINSIEGQRPEVRTRPPYPTQQGLFLKPTIVNNVETLAAVPYILKNGGKAYASLGTEKSKGTKLVCLDSFFNKPGVYEIEMGTPMNKIFNDFGGGLKSKVKAFQIGGPLGGIVPASFIDKLTLDFESFALNGFLLGHASVVSIPEDFPMIKYLEHLFEFAAYESCGKCFPCRLGTKRGHELISKSINENYQIEKNLMNDLLETLTSGSLCAHGGGIPLPVKNVLQHFELELKPYFK